MEKEKIKLENNLNYNFNIKKNKVNFPYFYLLLLLAFIYPIITIYIFIKVNYHDKIILSLLKEQKIKTKYFEKNHINNDNNLYSKIDKDMIGLEYPEIYYDKLKFELTEKNIIKTIIDFLVQLETKLIYLEKEINVTKISTFFHIRTSYLEKMKVKYNDSIINELHNIISWLVIHKSTQLKGIASDKYLACKYVEFKLRKNLCQHRIEAYDKIEDINFEKLIKKNDLVIKISNGCHDSVFINNNTKMNINEIKKKVSYYFNREYNLNNIPEFFHLYSKKRILVEKIFNPITDLYEFKFFIVNNKITFIKFLFFLGNKKYNNYYNANFEALVSKKEFNISSKFGENILSKLKEYAIKLSEDFKNFIRVDLYVFQNNIYLSELTFDSNSGKPKLRNEKFIIEIGKSWKRID